MAKQLKNFPTVFYLSLKDSLDRQRDLESQLSSRGVDFRMVEGYDGRAVDIRNQINITGSQLTPAGISSEVLSVAVSHLQMIYRWYHDTDEEIGFFCEDDINFSLTDYWNFDFKDFTNLLPVAWK